MCLLKVTADGSFKDCTKSFVRVRPKLPQLQRWFPIKGEADMIQQQPLFVLTLVLQ